MKADIDENKNQVETQGGEQEKDSGNDVTTASTWSPSGVWWKDFFHFVGPGWFVSIAYVDPGNYQADIQAGATSGYSLLFSIWWASILSIYVQILCVRLAYYGNVTLAEVQARNCSRIMRYMNWFIAELSTVLTDLPEVIGIGIACHLLFGWPYYVGVLLSLVTTMVFLCMMHVSVRGLEMIIFLFVGIMSIALWAEMSFVGVNSRQLMEGWVYGFMTLKSSDIFTLTGILGAVVMPHNLYLHTAACQSRKVSVEHVEKAVRYCSIEPVVPILVSFFVNMAIVAIASEKVYGSDNAENAGIQDFCDYFRMIKSGCVLWSIALLSAGQSSAITTTYTGQYVMDGFLNIQLPIRLRALITRLVAITPCVLVSLMFPDQMNHMVNIVNSALGFLLPFAFTPLVKFNCDSNIMGHFASKGYEKIILYLFAFTVWAVNAIALSIEGGGFFGDLRSQTENTLVLLFILLFEISLQTFYAWWMINCLFLSPSQQQQGTFIQNENEMI